MRTKQCSKCKRVKPLDEFYQDVTSADGRYPSCKQCKRKYKRQYYAEHREEERERKARWHADNPDYDALYRATHRKKRSECSAQWHAEHPDYHHQYRDYHHQYRIDNASKYRTYSANRYALSMAAAGAFTDEQFTQLCNQYGNRCLCCSEITKLTVDHIVPLNEGGSNDINNIQPLCQSCNSKKGTKTIDYRKQLDKGERPDCGSRLLRR